MLFIATACLYEFAVDEVCHHSVVCAQLALAAQAGGRPPGHQFYRWTVVRNGGGGGGASRRCPRRL